MRDVIVAYLLSFLSNHFVVLLRLNTSLNVLYFRFNTSLTAFDCCLITLIDMLSYDSSKMAVHQLHSGLCHMISRQLSILLVLQI
jgi:hypothetical protein